MKSIKVLIFVVVMCILQITGIAYANQELPDPESKDFIVKKLGVFVNTPLLGVQSLGGYAINEIKPLLLSNKKPISEAFAILNALLSTANKINSLMYSFIYCKDLLYAATFVNKCYAQEVLQPKFQDFLDRCSEEDTIKYDGAEEKYRILNAEKIIDIAGKDLKIETNKYKEYLKNTSKLQEVFRKFLKTVEFKIHKNSNTSNFGEYNLELGGSKELNELNDFTPINQKYREYVESEVFKSVNKYWGSKRFAEKLTLFLMFNEYYSKELKENFTIILKNNSSAVHELNIMFLGKSFDAFQHEIGHLVFHYIQDFALGLQNIKHTEKSCDTVLGILGDIVIDPLPAVIFVGAGNGELYKKLMYNHKEIKAKIKERLERAERDEEFKVEYSTGRYLLSLCEYAVNFSNQDIIIEGGFEASFGKGKDFLAWLNSKLNDNMVVEDASDILAYTQPKINLNNSLEIAEILGLFRCNDKNYVIPWSEYGVLCESALPIKFTHLNFTGHSQYNVDNDIMKITTVYNPPNEVLDTLAKMHGIESKDIKLRTEEIMLEMKKVEENEAKRIENDLLKIV